MSQDRFIGGPERGRSATEEDQQRLGRELLALKDERTACGGSAEEAVREVQIAKAAWLRVAKDRGKPIPKPRYRPAIYQLAQ